MPPSWLEKGHNCEVTRGEASEMNYITAVNGGNTPTWEMGWRDTPCLWYTYVGCRDPSIPCPEGTHPHGRNGQAGHAMPTVRYVGCRAPSIPCLEGTHPLGRNGQAGHAMPLVRYVGCRAPSILLQARLELTMSSFVGGVSWQLDVKHLTGVVRSVGCRSPGCATSDTDRLAWICSGARRER